jgi:Cdc6-like AAA superfamily ATPase
LKDRLGEGVVPDVSIDQIADKVASTSGDARSALEFMAKALQSCLEDLSKNDVAAKKGPIDV